MEQLEIKMDKKTYFQEYRKAHRTEILENLHRCREKQQSRKEFMMVLEELIPKIKERLC